MSKLLKEQYKKDYASFVNENSNAKRKDILLSAYSSIGYSKMQSIKIYNAGMLFFKFILLYALSIICVGIYTKLEVFEIVLFSFFLCLCLFGFCFALFYSVFDRSMVKSLSIFFRPRRLLFDEIFEDRKASSDMIEILLNMFAHEHRDTIEQYLADPGVNFLRNGRIYEFIYSPTNRDSHLKELLSSFSANITEKIKDLENAKQALLERANLISDIPVDQKLQIRTNRL